MKNTKKTTQAQENNTLRGLYLTCKAAIKSNDWTRESVIAYAEVMPSIADAVALKGYCEPIAKDLRNEAKKDEDFVKMDKTEQKNYLSKIVEHNRRMILAALFLKEHGKPEDYLSIFDKTGFFKMWSAQAEVFKSKKASASKPAQADNASASASQPAQADNASASASQPAQADNASASASASQPAQADNASAPIGKWLQACRLVDDIARIELTKDERIGIVAELMAALQVTLDEVKKSEEVA